MHVLRKNGFLLFLLFFPLFALIASSVSYGNDIDKILESSNSFIIDDFEEENAWTVKYSQFRYRNWNQEVTKKTFYEESKNWLKWINIDDYPNLRLFHHEISNDSKLSATQKKILAVRSKWLPKGQFEWIAIEPANIRYAKDIVKPKINIIADEKTLKPKYREWDENRPNYIWLPVKTRELFVYVWSGNYDYSLEAEFQDTKGEDYIIHISKLNYYGWKNLKIPMPEKFYNSQISKVAPLDQNIKFIRFIVKNKNQNNLNHHYTNHTIYLYFDYFYANVDEVDLVLASYQLQFFDQIWENKGTSNKTVETNTNTASSNNTDTQKGNN